MMPTCGLWIGLLKKSLEETTSYVFGAATYGKVEAKKMKMRTMRARNEVAKEGLYVGHLADGYCVVQTERGKEIKVDEDRIKVIKRIFDLYTQGYTIDRINLKYSTLIMYQLRTVIGLHLQNSRVIKRPTTEKALMCQLKERM